MAIAWVAPEKMEHPDWVAVGQGLGEMGRVNNWWVGDWLHYGTARWGEKYVEAVKITGFDGKTLRNIVYVASRFDLSRRRDKLTFTHHAEVAALEFEEQEEWLDRAIALALTATDLRLELRTSQRGIKSAGEAGRSSIEGAEFVSDLLCPRCGFDLRSAGKTEANRCTAPL